MFTQDMEVCNNESLIVAFAVADGAYILRISAFAGRSRSGRALSLNSLPTNASAEFIVAKHPTGRSTIASLEIRYLESRTKSISNELCYEKPDHLGSV